MKKARLFALAALEVAIVASSVAAFSGYPDTTIPLPPPVAKDDEPADLCTDSPFPVCSGGAYYANMLSMWCASTFPPGCCQYKLWEYQCNPGDPMQQVTHKYWYPNYRCVNLHCVP